MGISLVFWFVAKKAGFFIGKHVEVIACEKHMIIIQKKLMKPKSGKD